MTTRRITGMLYSTNLLSILLHSFLLFMYFPTNLRARVTGGGGGGGAGVHNMYSILWLQRYMPV